jgi:adenine-specific DNA-methyltransferase
VIKYLGSKRRLVGVLGDLTERSGAATAADVFTGTTRVAQELKRRGAHVWANDTTRYAEAFARCYIETNVDAVDLAELDSALAELDALPGREGYFTDTFCRRSRFLQPHNGARVDAIRAAIADGFAGHPLEPVLLTSLVEAADRVDSTTGVQMAYLKQWAQRSHRPLQLRRPELLPGAGAVSRLDARAAAAAIGPVDLAYLDPPYNQHSYLRNYHVWETLVAWDAPPVYGVACKREECRDPATRSPFNSKPAILGALRETIGALRARLVVLSYSDEGWIALEDLVELCCEQGTVEVLAFDSARYVGARIGIHNPRGERVGSVGRLRNVEYVLVAGDRADVAAAVGAARTARAA